MSVRVGCRTRPSSRRSVRSPAILIRRLMDSPFGTVEAGCWGHRSRTSAGPRPMRQRLTRPNHPIDWHSCSTPFIGTLGPAVRGATACPDPRGSPLGRRLQSRPAPVPREEHPRSERLLILSHLSQRRPPPATRVADRSSGSWSVAIASNDSTSDPSGETSSSSSSPPSLARHRRRPSSIASSSAPMACRSTSRSSSRAPSRAAPPCRPRCATSSGSDWQRCRARHRSSSARRRSSAGASRMRAWPRHSTGMRTP